MELPSKATLNNCQYCLFYTLSSNWNKLIDKQIIVIQNNYFVFINIIKYYSIVSKVKYKFYRTKEKFYK